MFFGEPAAGVAGWYTEFRTLSLWLSRNWRRPKSGCDGLMCEVSGRGSAWLERLVRDQEVGGSNPLAPTKFLQSFTRLKFPLKSIL